MDSFKINWYIKGMRIILFLLISCFTLSNAASAAMVCCMDINKSQSKQISELPCHDMSEKGDNNSPETQHQCECQGCIQFTHISNDTAIAYIAITPIQTNYYNNFTSPEPDNIYYPPKVIS